MAFFYSQSLIAKTVNPQLISLSKNSYWHHLLHFRAQGFFRDQYSQGDDPNFFLSPIGQYDPLSELQYSIDAFSKTDMPDNTSEQCRFPARFYWLRKQLININFVSQPCSEFIKFFNDVKGDSLTVVYPASYLNSPSSMYGHTLVRIDREDESRSKLLAYSVNFAANADKSDNDIVFSYKGLAGGYPGVVSVIPYYQKVNEYSHLESRDIWEYKLNLSKSQVDQFVRHIWETRDTFFDYYFIGENCSYRLVALLDASVPELNLADDFPFRTVPIDTVRILKTRQLVKDVVFRPSVSTQLNSMRNQSSEDIQLLARQLIDDPKLINSQRLLSLSELEQAKVLELAYAYSRYLSVQNKQATPVLRKTSLGLLSKRSKISIKEVFKSVEPPVYRDDEGHQTQRGLIVAGQTENEAYTQFGYRLTYHDLLDPVEGFLPGAQIQMGNVNLRQYQNKSLKVQDFNVVDIISLSTRNDFVKPTAWRVSGAFERQPGVDGLSYWTLNGGAGLAYDFFQGILYGFAEAELATGNDLDKEYRLAAGGKLGWLYQHANLQINTHVLLQDDVAGMEGERTQFNISASYNLKRNLQVRLNTQRQKINGTNINDWNIGLGLYF